MLARGTKIYGYYKVLILPARWRRRRSRVVELHRSIHAVSRASGEPWHRAKAAMLVADCASEALTTEDELRRERSGVQCEAQASLSAL